MTSSTLPPDSVAGCLACAGTAAADLPPRERVVRTAHWRVAHAFDTALPGWLVLLPTSHVTAVHDLDDGAADELGPLMRDLSRALAATVGCVKTYVMQFAEAEGFAHAHVHVVPRMADQPPALRGPGVFAVLGVPPQEQVTEADRDSLAAELAAAMPARWSAT